jgi:hypothetical protein
MGYINAYKTNSIKFATSISKASIERGMFLEIQYKKTRKEIPKGVKKVDKYYIVVLDIRKEEETDKIFLHALDLNEIPHNVFEGKIVNEFGWRVGVRIGKIKYSKLNLQSRGNAKSVYESSISKYLNTSAKNSYKTFNVKDGIQGVKIFKYHHRFTPGTMKIIQDGKVTHQTGDKP